MKNSNTLQIPQCQFKLLYFEVGYIFRNNQNTEIILNFKVTNQNEQGSSGLTNLLFALLTKAPCELLPIEGILIDSKC